MKTLCLAALALGIMAIGGPAFPDARADAVDDCVATEMREHHITGLSLAIIDGGKIVRAKGYGFTDRTNQIPITPLTLFQAGSISKSVSALGALRLVEQGRLSLDEDVNIKLRSWKVPENDFTKDKKVTLRGILSHTAGLTVHGFPGYVVDDPIPTLVQILDGTKPANTPAIRVDLVPDSAWRYSGGGYTVMQQMVIDVTGQPFPKFMEETVLRPLGMTNSTYEQPLPPAWATNTAAGYTAFGFAVGGHWHVYPEMAAAGLWTTPSDLARFAIGIQQSLAAKSNPVISRLMTQRMLTDQKNNDGLGVFLRGFQGTLWFNHSGRDEGFDADVRAGADSGQGAAIMINANDNSGITERLANVISKEYRWVDRP